jgi:hypothetical protein
MLHGPSLYNKTRTNKSLSVIQTKRDDELYNDILAEEEGTRVWVNLSSSR